LDPKKRDLVTLGSRFPWQDCGVGKVNLDYVVFQKFPEKGRLVPPRNQGLLFWTELRTWQRRGLKRLWGGHHPG